ncbi:agmatinase [Zhenhengia yiwuensis]|uniref:Agmatinase n=1 Tax=Zhenhengia yiwuensis TaxID=2763666 RepID=A0A926I8F1_9FIRM|nr:agmatinase [Zhenhengia yiwuensis]MBC8578585.1 agmatinase [Zhenhengia yiwuensis]
MHNISTTSSFIGFDQEYDTSPVVLVGIPFDGTTSFRPGTRFAPAVVRPDSYGLETYSPYLDLDMEDYNLCDLGDIELPFGNTTKALNTIYKTFAQIIKDGKRPLTIGGEHLVSLPIIEAFSKIYPDLCIIHFDAHTDLREDYMGESLSHASVIRRAWDILGDNRIFQFGIRSGTKVEFDWAKSHTYLQPFNLDSLEEIIIQLQNRPVYITIDLDVLDPSIFPGTGTPEPGGIDFNTLIFAIKQFTKLNHIVGADVVELSPHYDISGVSTATCCKVIREMSLLLSHKQ